jgi:hypothetical protein
VFVIGKPRNKAFTAHQLAATEADGGNGRATLDPSGDDVAYMRFRAVQQFSNRRQRQKPKIIQSIHWKTPSFRPPKTPQKQATCLTTGQGGYRLPATPSKRGYRLPMRNFLSAAPEFGPETAFSRFAALTGRKQQPCGTGTGRAPTAVEDHGRAQTIHGAA